MLDSFDVMLYSLVLAALMNDLGLSKGTAGVLGSITLISAAIGGLAFGVVADRYGRTRALMASVLLYAIATATCGFAQNLAQLAVARIFVGFGMGGEWASGASLVSETWPDEHRGKALGLMQSFWAVGYALAAITAAVVMPRGGWRAVFFVGVLPALITLWIQRNVQEPDLWQTSRSARKSYVANFAGMFRGRFRTLTAAITLMNSCTLFAWWGFNVWVPAYLSLPVTEGGIGLSVRMMTALVVAMQVGMWCGYITFGFVSDAIGRKRTYVTFLLAATFLMLAYGSTRSPFILLLLGPLVAFFGTGYYSGFGAVTAEVYETRVRATAQGFTYNVGRIASAAAPFAVGSLAQRHGFSVAFQLAAFAFLFAAALWLWIPETRGRLNVG
jgi:MFS family permease